MSDVHKSDVRVLCLFLLLSFCASAAPPSGAAPAAGESFAATTGAGKCGEDLERTLSQTYHNRQIERRYEVL